MTTLKSLLVPSKETEISYPGIPDFKLKICFLSRETLQNLRKRATKTTFKARQPVEELNDDLFLQLYVKECIKGWTGLRFRDVETLAPVDLSAIEDKDAELEYSEENALELMKGSVDFDQFISQQVTELGNFLGNK